MEIAKPIMINDEDCDTEYPAALPDETGDSLGLSQLRSGAPLPRSTFLLASTQVTRLYQPLLRVLRSLCISSDTLNEFDKHLADCMRLFPTHWHLTSADPLDVCEIVPIMHFQNTRLLICRHNLSPSCSGERRAQAIEQCLKISCDTATVLSRCTDVAVPFSSWQAKLRNAASTFVCTHLWRCMLFTVFKGFFDAFYAILRVAALIGDSRAVNTKCGRYLGFFLTRIVEKLQTMKVTEMNWDEEIIALLSADMQSSSSNSWVWDGAETGTYLAKRQKHGRTKQANRPSQSSQSPVSPEICTSTLGSALLDQEAGDWEGWEQVENAARYLQQQWHWPQAEQAGIPRPRVPEGHQAPGHVPILPAPAATMMDGISPTEPPKKHLSSSARMDINNFI